MASSAESKFGVTAEKQASLPRFFYHQITAKPEVVAGVSLEGKTAIVTGANTGVGFETSRQLLDLGISKLILAVRSEEKGAAAAARLAEGRTGLKDGTIAVWKLDLCIYDSVVAFAQRAQAELSRLDIAILNAGIGPINRSFNDVTGHDQVIQVNYLSTALLAILLLPVIKSKRASQPGPSRLTIVSSEVSAWTKFAEGTQQPPPASILAALDKKEPKVNMLDRMMVSKLLGQFFLTEIAKRVPADLVVINAASPGSVYDSDFNRDQDGTVTGAIAKSVMKRVANSAAVGARMITDAAVQHGEETHGEFLSFQKVVPLAPIIYTADGAKISEQLWKETLAEFSFAGAEGIVESLRS